MVAPGKRVLVVDDEDVVCKSYKRVLSRAGFDVHTARCGRDGIDAFNRQPFDLVLADLKMPDMDGMEVTRVIKSARPDVQVIIITGYGTRESQKIAEQLGVFEYLNKPLSPEKLSAVTAEALATPPPEIKEQPVSQAAPAMKPVEAEKPATPAPAPSEPRPGLAKSLGMLAVAPFAGLAYVLFLPFIGFAMLFMAAVSGLGKAVGIGRKD